MKYGDILVLFINKNTSSTRKENFGVKFETAKLSGINEIKK